MLNSMTLKVLTGSVLPNAADQWVFSLATTPRGARPSSTRSTRHGAREAIGVEDLEIEGHRISHWRLESVIAGQYRFGRVFLACDSAHRYPPIGGLGMNSASRRRSQPLLEAGSVLGGRGGESLLESNGQERRPVALRNAEQSPASTSTERSTRRSGSPPT
jgi:2,4-dichlorophenol 6-monooxygenase